MKVIKQRLLLQASVRAFVGMAFCALSHGASAGVFTFSTPTGATLDGKPVSAAASFTTSLNQISLTITNLQANPTSVIQAISDIFFTAGGVTTGSGFYTPSADYVAIARNGTTSGGACCANWSLTNSGGTYHLNGLAGQGAGGSGPGYLILGAPGAGGVYTNANGSIAGNRPHNPFIDQSATFTLALAGVTSATQIANVVFSFGTESGVNVPGVPGVPAVPIPGALWLFGSGLAGLLAFTRRRRAAATASPRGVVAMPGAA